MEEGEIFDKQACKGIHKNIIRHKTKVIRQKKQDTRHKEDEREVSGERKEER